MPLMLHRSSGLAKSAAIIQGRQRLDRSPPKIEAELRHERPTTQYKSPVSTDFWRPHGICKWWSIKAIWHGMAPTCTQSRDARCTHARWGTTHIRFRNRVPRCILSALAKARMAKLPGSCISGQATPSWAPLQGRLRAGGST